MYSCVCFEEAKHHEDFLIHAPDESFQNTACLSFYVHVSSKPSKEQNMGFIDLHLKTSNITCKKDDQLSTSLILGDFRCLSTSSTIRGIFDSYCRMRGDSRSL